MPGDRSAHIDNVKAALMFSVVWYHSLLVWYTKELPVGVSGLESLLLLAIMPGFALVSGFLASPKLTRRRQDTLITTFFVFVIFQLINWLMDAVNKSVFAIIQHNKSTTTPQAVEFPIPLFFPTVIDQAPDTPGGLPVTWFLLCLLFWRALTPIFDRLKRPLITSFVIGILSLSIDLGFGSQNVVSFLPFYVFGYVMNHKENYIKWWDTCVKKSNKLLSCFLMCFSCSFIILSALLPVWWKSSIGFVVGHAYGCLYGLRAPSAPACTSLASFGTRIIFYMLSLPAMFLIFRFAPMQKRRLWTKAGKNSVAIYLWHPIFLFNIATIVVMGKVLNMLTGTKAPPYHGAPAFIAITCMAILFFCILSANFWRVCCGLCLSPPVVRWLFVRSETGVHGGWPPKDEQETIAPASPGGYTMLTSADDAPGKVQRWR